MKKRERMLRPFVVLNLATFSEKYFGKAIFHSRLKKQVIPAATYATAGITAKASSKHDKHLKKLIFMAEREGFEKYKILHNF